MQEITQTPSNRVLSTSRLLNNLANLREFLTESSRDEIAKSIRILISQFAVRNEIDFNLMVDGYVLALDKVPSNILRKVISNILKGEYKDHDAKFMPTSAMIRRWCNEEHQKINKEMQKIEDMLKLLDDREKYAAAVKRDRTYNPKIETILKSMGIKTI